MDLSALIPTSISALLVLAGVIYSAKSGAKTDLYGHQHEELERLKQDRNEEREKREEMVERLDAVEYDQDLIFAYVEKLERHIDEGKPPPPPPRPDLSRFRMKGLQP